MVPRTYPPRIKGLPAELALRYSGFLAAGLSAQDAELVILNIVRQRLRTARRRVRVLEEITP